MAFKQAMLLSSPPGLATSNTLKAMSGPNASRWSMNGIQGRGIKERMKFLEVHETRCDSQKLSAILNNLNNSNGPAAMRRKSHNRSHILAASEHTYTLRPDDHYASLWTRAVRKLDAFLRFIRLFHGIIIVLVITSMASLPVECMTDLSPLFFVGLVKTILPIFFMGIYTIGINQVFDVEIDKVNKPSLPLASGDLSMEEGILITTAFCTMSLLMGVKSGSPPLLCAVLAVFFLGSAYSINLPLLRWKENPFLTTLFTVCNLGIVHHIPLFMHFQKYVLGKPLVLTKSIVFATVFMSLSAAVQSILKDIPDLEGDKRAGIQNFVVRLGPERVFWLGTNALLVGYGLAMLVGAASANPYSRLITVLGHGLLASILWVRARSVDIQSKTSTESFYGLIWQLKAAQYLLIPFVR